MKALLINYAHRNVGVNYTPFFDAIKNNSFQWWHFLEPTWIVTTTHTAHSFTQLLLPHIRANDSLLVIRVTSEHQGWLPKEAWDWLNSIQYE